MRKQNSEKLMEAMGGIRQEYLAAANKEEQKMVSIAEARAEKRSRVSGARIALAAAAVVLCSIALPNLSPVVAGATSRIPFLGIYFESVTFRNYEYQDDTHEANIETPVLTVEGSADADANEVAIMEETAAEVNSMINERTGELVSAFRKTLEDEGYSALEVYHEVLTDNDSHYSIVVRAFTAQADGYEESDYYTIDKSTGKLLTLSDLYEGDYVDAISNELKEKMIAANEAGTADYFVAGYDDVTEDMGFVRISEDQSFYIDSEGRTVICFNEGEVGPMSMGEVNITLD